MTTPIVEELNKAVGALRETTEKRLTDQDTLLQDKANKISADIQKTAAEINQKFIEAEAARKAMQEQVNSMVQSMGSAKGGEGKAKKSKFGDKFVEYLRKGTGLKKEDQEGIVRELIEGKNFGGDTELEVKNFLAAGSNPDGGYFIVADRQEMIEGRIFETSPIRLLATVSSTSSDRVERPLDDDEASSGGWVGETESRTDTNTPQVGMVIIPIHEQYAQPRATQKMLNDAGFDVAGWLQRKVSDKFSRDENTAFVKGDGSKRTKGFLSYSAWSVAGTYERDKIEQVVSGSATTFTGDSFKKLQNSLKEAYQGNAVWGMRRSAWSLATQLKDSNNRYLFELMSNFRDGDSLQLLGKKVILMDDMPDVGASALAVIYGDFRQGYEIVDRLGMTVLRDPFTSKPYVRFYCTKFVGGAVTNFEALKIMKIST